jgi:hypothetical protein
MVGMAHKKRHSVEEEEVVGLKYFKKISGLLERLHDAGCERDRAGNRRLFMDQYLTLLLLFMFNPVCESLRGLQQASQLKKVQRALGVPRASLGSLSEAATVFDAALLREIVGELVEELRPLPHDARLDQVKDILTLVDGTWLTDLPRVARWALWQEDRRDKRGAKAHVEFEVLKGVPVAATVTNAHTSEPAVLEASLRPGRLYVVDRGYAAYALFQAIVDADSSFVGRLHDNAVLEVLETRPLSPEAVRAGLLSDRVGRLGCKFTKDNLTAAVRVVEVACTPHRKPSGKTARGGPEQGDRLRLVTNRLDLEADLIGVIYQARWQIETFFRTFKHVLGCRHLVSYSENGIALQTYAAILACLLIALWTGRRPTLRTYEMLCYYFTGWADLEELQTHLAALKREPLKA